MCVSSPAGALWGEGGVRREEAARRSSTRTTRTPGCIPGGPAETPGGGEPETTRGASLEGGGVTLGPAAGASDGKAEQGAQDPADGRRGVSGLLLSEQRRLFWINLRLANTEEPPARQRAGMGEHGGAVRPPELLLGPSPGAELQCVGVTDSLMY